MSILSKTVIEGSCVGLHSRTARFVRWDGSFDSPKFLPENLVFSKDPNLSSKDCGHLNITMEATSKLWQYCHSQYHHPMTMSTTVSPVVFNTFCLQIHFSPYLHYGWHFFFFTFKASFPHSPWGKAHTLAFPQGLMGMVAGLVYPAGVAN